MHDHNFAFADSKINLNFVDGNSGCSDRVYKILAARGFLLTQPWPRMEIDFKNEKDLVVFHTVGELKKLIEYYLANSEQRNNIAQNGYETVQKFSRDNWAKKILEITEVQHATTRG